MKPYYQDELVTLYHGDCLEIDAWLAADVLVTDPPYGMSYSGFGGRRGENRPAICFGRWSEPRPRSTRQVLIWDKSDNGPGMGALDLPWGPSFEEVYVIGKGYLGKRSGSVLRVPGYTSGASDRPVHPTPKPVGLIERCPPGVIADPFAGSGATLVAARNLGRQVIGVKLEEKYCAVIARRLEQQPLFTS